MNKIISIALMIISFKNYGQVAIQMDSIAKIHVMQGFNGNILYSKNDSIIFYGAYGYANFDNEIALNRHTIFELASVSKQFTALAIMQLIEAKKLQYKTKVNTIIAGFPYKNITIEHLLRHQSGLPELHNIFYNKKLWNRRHIATNKDLIHILKTKQLDLVFTPGTKYDYNNSGYVILASIIEIVSKQSYKQYIDKYIFKPAGMSTAMVYTIEDSPENYNNTALAYTYNKRKKNYQTVKKDKHHKHVSWMNGLVGDRGIYASVLDLEAWKQALRNNKLITQKSKQLMFSTDNISPKYGFGFAIYTTKTKGKWIYHNGSWSGYKTSAIYLPKNNEYLVILSNNRYSETYKSLEESLYEFIKK